MNEVQKRRAHNREKSFPGCMGRVGNLFDFSPGMTGNRLLMDKAHQDGSPLPSNPLYAPRNVLDPIGDRIEDKPIRYELRRSSANKRSNGTPMKMLIAQEMSRVMESKQKPPSVVAKLMGLDALPGKQPNSTAQRSQPKVCSRITQPGTLLTNRQQENGFLDKQIQCEIHPFQEQRKYKDVYEVWQQSPKTKYIKDKSPQKGRYTENTNEANMALVRKKFIEAKRLATDEKLRQSKEFQDALEVLSSNKDLFLKFLQEPNSLFSQHLYELQSIPPPPQTKRITVLKPSKTLENNRFVGLEKTSEKQMQKQNQVVEDEGLDKDKPGYSPLLTNQKDDGRTQPTRIVVLKPSPQKTPDIKAMVSPPSFSPRLLYGEESEDDEAQCPTEVAKESTLQTSESSSSHRREETLLSSVLSNGYVGDESSFNRSENAYRGEENLSDSEVMTPISRYSWDYINRFDSPYSSSFSRASYSPESSVCREAKKRLSERWAMMASNGNGQEQRQLRRSSSTLGEMLSLSDTKKSTRFGEESIQGGIGFLSSRSCGGEQDLRDPTSSLSANQDNDGGEDSPRNLLRSRSVPVSSTAYGARLNVEVSDPEVGKTSIPKEVEKPKSGKSSFKGKVSSLFFSRNKKQSKKKPRESHFAGSQDKFEPSIAEIPGVSEKPSTGKLSDDISECVKSSDIERGSSLAIGGSSSKTSSPASTCVQPKQGTFHEAVLSQAKHGMPGTQSENQDQPSPISVLDGPFEDDNMNTQPYGKVKSDFQGQPVDLQPLKSNLISKSPPIETLARSLSWDDACSVVVTPDPLNSIVPSESGKEQEWLLFIQTLLSSTTMDNEEHSHQAFARWHSLESPLDPLLIEKFVNLKDDKEKWHEAKRRQRRSNQKLIFDCVNAALVEITGYGSNSTLLAKVSTGVQKTLSVGSPVTAEEVWDRMKEWFSSEAKCFSGDSEDNNLVVERVVKKELGGRGWVELMRFEVDDIGKEIEGKMFEELVEEALFELTGSLF